MGFQDVSQPITSFIRRIPAVGHVEVNPEVHVQPGVPEPQPDREDLHDFGGGLGQLEQYPVAEEAILGRALGCVRHLAEL